MLVFTIVVCLKDVCVLREVNVRDFYSHYVKGTPVYMADSAGDQFCNQGHHPHG